MLKRRSKYLHKFECHTKIYFFVDVLITSKVSTFVGKNNDKKDNLKVMDNK